MASSDDHAGELVPRFVTNYYFEGANSEPVSFAVLPLFSPATPGGNHVFLRGSSGGGLHKVFKQVTAWRVRLRGDRPEISVLSVDGNWITLLKPRRIYVEETARSVLATVYVLHFLRKKPEASEKTLFAHLNRVFSVENVPSVDDFRENHELIRAFVEKDKVLAKCALLPMFLIQRPRKRISSEDVQNEPGAKKGFIDDDNEADEGLGGDDSYDSEEEPDLFDSACAICDNGGDLLCCEGKCLRSFHATRNDGIDSDCKSLGYSRSQVKAFQNFLCKNCRYKQHQCFACGKLGSSDKSACAEVYPCVNATCGHFYHPKCAARLLYRDNEEEATDCQKQIAAGESFMCPVHKCVVCNKGENKEVKELQFAVCRRCPKSYHRRCLPRDISFDDIEEDIIQRAWDDLLPNRILIYCLDHKIDGDLGTPIRNHIRFPEIPEKKKVTDVHKMKVNVLVKNTIQDSDILPRKKKNQDFDKLSKVNVTVKQKNVTEGKLSTTERGRFLIKSDRFNTEQVPESKIKMKPLRDIARPSPQKADGTVPVDSTASSKDKTKNSPLAYSTRKSSFPVIDGEIEKKILALMENTSASLTLADIIRKRTMPSTHAYSGKHIDKSITYGKVEGSVEAIRAAIKKIENGGNVDDAKAVCEPGILKQIPKWSSKLGVYLAPFIHGSHYTSFGRHFTKVDKLIEIVDKLHWYIQNGDTIVDFCCGSNDFSLLMKGKLDESGKKCSFKNFDLIQPKNDFCFEKRDWMTVQPNELPTGSQLIMGLNPPFGYKASLANKFIDKALTFKPKLIILIVPPETERLDKKRPPYELVWEDFQKLSGKSFYLPGSVDVEDKQIEQWNNTPPVLYLWSRPDWAAKHKSIALKQGHTEKEHYESPSGGPQAKERVKVHENMVAAFGREDTMRGSNRNKETQSNKRWRENRKEGFLKRRKTERKEETSNGSKVDELLDMRVSPLADSRDSREMSKHHVSLETPEAPSEMRSNTPERTNQVALPKSGWGFGVASGGGIRTDVLDDIYNIAKRYSLSNRRDDLLNSGPNNQPVDQISCLDYGSRASEEPLSNYIRNGTKSCLNDYDVYGKISEVDARLEPGVYGMQGEEDLYSQSRFPLSGSDMTSLSQPGQHSSPSGIQSLAAGSAALEQYSVPGGLPPSNSIHDIPGMRGHDPPASTGFAPGSHHAYPRRGSSGWLDD